MNVSDVPVGRPREVIGPGRTAGRDPTRVAAQKTSPLGVCSPANYLIAADRLLPNMLPYTVGTPAVFGFASWNGRSLIDNAPDVMCSLVTNTPVSLGIGKESVSPSPSTVFPYAPLLPPRA